MTKTLSARIAASLAVSDQWKPDLIRLTEPGGRARVDEVLGSGEVVVFDSLISQVKELIRSLNPAAKYTAGELDKAAEDHIGSTGWQDYGVWVHYPWSRRLVHLLDEAEFALVRTDRNRNKITRAEQEVLSTKRVGIIGLSVGQSIALTMAMERSFGEIRLADFDTLDLSNLNRIRSGVHNLGLRKVVNVAREIMEIDPFLKVTCYDEGITRNNIEQFCTAGGKLDVLVDECDSVDVKIFCRQTAKSLGIPVVMDTSDRGMVDVERFDLEPERPILHGLIDHLDPSDAAKAKSNEEKLPFVLPIAGFETLSPRMKASMLEIENSVTTWPQLASSVVLGGAVAGDVCRRIMLDESRTSGRWFLDLDHSVAPSISGATNSPLTECPFEPLSLDDMLARARELPTKASKSPLSSAQAEHLAEAGCQAPSAGNSQPWKFLLYEGMLLIFHDKSRSYSRLDEGSLLPLVAFGACIENIELKAQDMGLALSISLTDKPQERGLVAVVSLDGSAVPSMGSKALAGMIGARCTNRRRGNGEPISTAVLASLERVAGEVHGCSAAIMTDPDQLDRLADLVGAAERLRILNPIGHAELFEREIRWTHEETRRTRDGLDLDTFELRSSERAGLRLAADTSAVGLLRAWAAGSGFRKMSGDAIRSSSAAALICAPTDRADSLLQGGRATQRLWLQATAAGISVHPVSAPLLLAHHVRHGRTGFTEKEREEILALATATEELFGPVKGRPMFILRLAVALPPTARSLRLPVEHVFHLARTVTA